MTVDARRFRNLAVTAALIAGAAVLLCWGVLVHDGLPNGFSVAKHVSWARGFIESLGNGVVYPRWVAEINRGLGGPTFVFYGPLSYYLVAIVNLLTGNLILSIRLTIFLGALVAGWTMFWFARSFASRGWATVASIAYIVFPYAAYDIYRRLDLAEFLAFAWVPLIFLAIRRLANKPTTGSWIFLALTYAGLVLTHIVTAFLALFIVGPYAIALAIRKGTWRRSLPAILSAGFVGTLCAGVYLVPALVERPYTHLDAMVRKVWEQWDHAMLFLPPYHLARWKHRPRLLLEVTAGCQAAIVFCAVMLTLVRKQDAGYRHRDAERWLLLGLWLWTFALTTPLSWPLWTYVPELSIVQFPTRFLLFNALLTAALLAMVGSSGGETARAKPGRERESRLVAWARRPATVYLVLGLAALPAVSFTILTERKTRYSFTTEVAAFPENTTVVVNEYVPTVVRDDRSIRHLPPSGVRASLDPSGSARVTEWRSQQRTITTSSPVPAVLTVRTFFFPGWRATVDGRATAIEAAHDSGMMKIDVPAGTHEVRVRFGTTPDRRVGAATSVVGLILLLGVFARGRLKERSADG